MAHGLGAPPDGSQGILCRGLRRDHRGDDHGFRTGRSDPGTLLERGRQRRGQCTGDGDHDVAGGGAAENAILPFPAVPSCGMDGDRVMVLAVVTILATS